MSYEHKLKIIKIQKKHSVGIYSVVIHSSTIVAMSQYKRRSTITTTKIINTMNIYSNRIVSIVYSEHKSIL